MSSLPGFGFDAFVVFNKYSVMVYFVSVMVVTPCRFNTALKLHVIPSDGRAPIKVALLINCLCVIQKRELLGLGVRRSAGR